MNGLPLSSGWTACDNAWRFTAKQSCGNALAAGNNARQSSTSVRTAIADTAIAASNAAPKPVSISGGAPTRGINAALKDASIIATGSDCIATGAAAGNQSA
jgi:hypothetical protein